MSQRSTMGGYTRRSRATPSGPATRQLGSTDLIAGKVLVVAGLVAGGALAYLLYGLLSDHIGAFPNLPGGQVALTYEAQQGLLQAVQWASYLLAWCGLLTALCVLVRYYDTSKSIIIAGAIGLFLYVVIPAGVGLALAQMYHTRNELTDAIIMGTQAAGKITLILFAARAAAQLVLAAMQFRKTGKLGQTSQGGVRPTARPLALLRKCWHLDHCRAGGKACPRRRDNRSCWKVGEGCYCDVMLAEKTASGAQAWAHEEALAVRVRQGRGRTACKTCPLFEEHQYHKYRVLQWFAFPITAAIVIGGLKVIHAGYQWLSTSLDRGVAMLKFMPQSTDAAGVQAAVLSSNVEWVFVGCLWLLLVSWMLQLTEHLTLRKGW